MKNILLLFLSFLFVNTSINAQEENTSNLFRDLTKMDSLLFDAGFNLCNLEAMKNAVHDDFEFYHDQSGFNDSKANFLKIFEQNICGNADFKPIRKLKEGSLKVFPLKNNGILYGAIQNGVHEFYIKEPGKEPYLASVARFSHVWELEGERWKLKRVLSYDHREP
jgi:hypothetical protein